MAKLAVIPVPVRLELLDAEPFVLDAETVLLVPRGEREIGRAAERFAARVRRATGFPLPVEEEGGGGDARALELVLDAGASAGEGYALTASAEGVRVRAAEVAGLRHGLTTLRQLLPAAVEAEVAGAVEAGAWRVPAVEIEDTPRFGYRALMLDVARHFFTVEQVERLIDNIELYKVNVLQLHLSDDQGWRIEIKSRPRLTEHGGSTQAGGGPGGFYTQDEYTRLVGYAAERGITIVPEIDTPGHTRAALSSYGELDPSGEAPELYTETNVGISTLAVDSDETYRWLDEVVGEVAALTPGEYFHIGGDEVPLLQPEEYDRYARRAIEIVRAHGKTPIFWAPSVELAELEGPFVAAFWDSQVGKQEDPAVVRRPLSQGAKLVMAPARHTYLDLKYDDETPLGQKWAGLVPVRAAYDWDPTTVVDGVEEDDVLGVEAALWTETMVTNDDIDSMLFPRLPGVAEVGWSPRDGRSWEEYRERLAAQSARWETLGIAFHRAAGVSWPSA